MGRSRTTADACRKAAGQRRKTASRKRPDFIAELEHRGRERALTYKMLVLTGLRLNELRSLTVGQLELEGRVAFAVLAPADEKAGRGAEIPLRPDLVADLRDWLGERLDAARDAAKAKGLPLPARLPDDAPLLNVPTGLVTALNRDLRVAGIPKRDDRGRVLDIHALRHTFGTHLSKGGVAPRVAQAAMRHSTLELTMNTYTDPRLLDVAGALDALPALPPIDRPDAQRAKATGTDGGASDGCGFEKPDFPGKTQSDLPKSCTGHRSPEAENGLPDFKKTSTYAPRTLVPTLVPTSGKTCTRKAQAGTSGDERLSGGSDGSVAIDTNCDSVAFSDLKRAMGFEPTTSSLGSWHSTTELRPQPLESRPEPATRAATRRSRASRVLIAALGVIIEGHDVASSPGRAFPIRLRPAGGEIGVTRRGRVQPLQCPSAPADAPRARHT